MRMRRSAGGARIAGGVTFQAQVFASWAARAVAEKPPGLGLSPGARIETVGCETGFRVDDVGVILSDGGFIVIQAKGAMRQVSARASDLRDAVDQVVAAFIGGIRGDDPRPVEPGRDRLVIATNEESSQSFAALAKVCARLRDHPSALPITDAATSDAQRTALETFVEILRSRWTAMASAAPSDEEVRRLLSVVEVIRYDFAADGADRSRGEAMLEHAAVDDPFDRLVSVGVEAARTRSWRARRSLRQELGVPDADAGTAWADRERLGKLTEHTLDRLRRRHTAVRTPEGQIHVPRRIVSDLQQEPDGFLITGLPGVGKSGVLAELAALDQGDKVVLAVDSVPADRALAQIRWKLGDDLADVLRGWGGSEVATLYLDGLDAHRSGASWLADLVDELRDTRWRVVASIRRFELSHSRRWQEQFPDTPIGLPQPTVAALGGVRHVVVPSFDDHELAVVAARSPKTAALLDAGDERLRDLLANPFNLSLAADLVGQVPVARLAAVHTQVQLLATYWRARVQEGSGGYAREEAIRRLVHQMVGARSLETGLLGLPSDAVPAVEELVSRGVLDEVVDTRLVTRTTTIRFGHHIVFDFALARALLGTAGRGLAAVLANDADFVIFGRPAIDFHLADLWEADDDRRSFWRTTIDLALGDHPLAVAAATGIAVQQIGVAADFDRLVLHAEAHPDAVAAVVIQLASALGAASPSARSRAASSIEAYDTLVGKLGGIWLRGPEALHAQAFVMLIGQLDVLVPLPRGGAAAESHAATIVRLLEIAVADPPAQDWLGERVLRFISGAVHVDSRALPVLLSCLKRPVTDSWGLLHLRPVLQRLAEIAAVDPAAAGRLAAAPFLFDPSETRTVSIHPSQIIPMHESWSQAHAMLRYIVAQDGWGAFDAVYPVTATETLAVILSAFSDKGSRQFPISWKDVHGEVSEVSAFGRSLELSDLGNVSDLVKTSVNSLVRRSIEGSVDDVLAVWVSRVAHSEAWSRLLKAAADEPALARQLRAVVFESGGLFMNSETRVAAIRLISVLSPLVTPEEHQQLEQVALALPDSERDAERRRYMEQACDQVLFALDRDRIQVEAARVPLAAIDAPNESPQPAGPMRSFAMLDRSAEDLLWNLPGVDPATVPEAVKDAMAGAASALADAADEAAKWAAVSAAVAAESDPANHHPVVARLRYHIGLLLLQLTRSDRMLPDDPLGSWAAELLVALADHSPLPPPPKEAC
jgi:hypothetical protein